MAIYCTVCICQPVVYLQARSLQVLAYCTKGESTYIGDISTRPKLRKDSPRVRPVERYAQHPMLLETPGLGTHDPRPDGANSHRPQCHHRVWATTRRRNSKHLPKNYALRDLWRCRCSATVAHSESSGLCDSMRSKRMVEVERSHMRGALDRSGCDGATMIRLA